MEFEDNRDADDAVYELNGKELCGERVIVEHARGPRRDRDRDRDGYGGGFWGSGRSKCCLLQIYPLFPPPGVRCRCGLHKEPFFLGPLYN